MNRVIAPLGGTVLLVTLDEITRGHVPKPRVFIAFGFVVIVLGVMADSAPEIALPLAWLIFVAVVMTRGVNVFKRFGSSSTKGK